MQNERYLKIISAYHYQLIHELSSTNGNFSLELAELFEDIGNCYLNISEEISENHFILTKLAETESEKGPVWVDSQSPSQAETTELLG